MRLVKAQRPIYLYSPFLPKKKKRPIFPKPRSIWIKPLTACGNQDNNKNFLVVSWPVRTSIWREKISTAQNTTWTMR